MPNMDYSLIQRTPDGTGKILVTIPGIPDKGSYVLEADMKIYTNQGMVAIADIVDDLVTADATKPLSANQGVVLKQLIDAVSGGITPKGDILSTNLPAADDSNKGWQYYCTDLNKYATSDGTQWVYTSNSPIVQTPDATDTGHALSNAVVTQKCNAVEATLNQHESRIENLEQKAGDYSIVQYRGTDAVPTGKAHYGLVKNIVGKSRAWNQLAQNGNFADGTTGWQSGSATISANDGVLTVIPTGNNGQAYIEMNFTANHVYMLIANIKLSSANSTTRIMIASPSLTGSEYCSSGTSWQTVAKIMSSPSAGVGYLLFRDDSSVSQFNVKNVCFYDLTIIFGSGNEPATAADALSALPALGQYNPYDAGSLVSTTIEGVESVGVNIWDEQWEVGSINDTTGALETSTTQIRNKNKIPVFGGLDYYILMPNGTGRTYFYDSSDNLLYVGGINQSVSAPNGTSYMRFRSGVGYGATYLNNITIAKGSTAVTYHPYMTDTISLSETVTLRSAGSVADELDVESGEIKRAILGEQALSLLEWGAWNSENKAYSCLSNGRWKPCPNNQVANLVSSSYQVTTRNALLSYPKSISINHVGTMVIHDESFTGSGDVFEGSIVCELLTPTTEAIDPIIDNFIEVEGGGTINTIQEQTPVIDNCLDVGYLAV